MCGKDPIPYCPLRRMPQEIRNCIKMLVEVQRGNHKICLIAFCPVYLWRWTRGPSMLMDYRLRIPVNVGGRSQDLVRQGVVCSRAVLLDVRGPEGHVSTQSIDPWFVGLVARFSNVLDFAVLDDKRVTLASCVAKDFGGVEVKLQALGELASGVGDESDLEMYVNIVRRANPTASLTFEDPVGSSTWPQAFMTKGSFTDTTKTLPASFKLGCLR